MKDGDKEKIIEEDSNDNEDIAEKKAGGSKTVLIIIIAGFVLFMAMAGAGFYIIWQKMPGSSVNSVMTSEPETQKAPPKKGLGPIYSINPFVINLAGSGGKRFLRVKMDLELKDQTTFEQVHAQLPRVKDTLLTILSAKKFQDINTGEGKSDLRTEIVATMGSLFSKGAVTNVYLTEFVVE